MKNVKIILSYLLVFLWMGMIFYLSNQTAVDSGGLSTGVIKKILKVTGNFMSERFDIQHFDHLLRKNAHFFVYLILSILVLRALRLSGLGGHKALLVAFFICFLYAISDEFHQSFVAGRSGEIRDVAIDSLGSLFGILIYHYTMIIGEKRKNRDKKN